MNREMERMNVILTRALEYDGSQECYASQIRDLTEEDKCVEALLYRYLGDISTCRGIYYYLEPCIIFCAVRNTKKEKDKMG